MLKSCCSTSPEAPRIYTRAELEAFERANIERALERARGRIGGPGGAAELLQMPRTTLASRIKALEIRRPGELGPLEP